MRFSQPSGPSRRRYARKQGFTLLELIIALGVFSIAAWVYTSLFFNSVQLGNAARTRSIATALGEAQLAKIIHHPEYFQWQLSALDDDTHQFPIIAKQGVDNQFTTPDAMPFDDTSFVREEKIHGKFRWHAYGRYPDEQTPYCEIMLVVRWTEKGKKQKLLALTSCIDFDKVKKLAGGAAL